MISTSRRLAFLFSLLAAFGLWQLAAVRTNAPLILPAPLDVFRCIGKNVRDPAFLLSFGASCLRVLLAILLVLTTGSMFGLCSGLSGVFRSFITFPLAFIRAVPVVAIILLSVFWLGSSALPVFVALLMSLPVMVDSVAGGITKIPPRLLDAAKVYGFSKRKILFHVYLPAVAPSFFSGARTVFGLSWKVVVAGEVLVLPRFGAGTLLYTAKVHLETAQVFAIAILMVAVCFCLEAVFTACLPSDMFTGKRKRHA
jgi:NitT/TauT family transport system permease protein